MARSHDPPARVAAPRLPFSLLLILLIGLGLGPGLTGCAARGEADAWDRRPMFLAGGAAGGDAADPVAISEWLQAAEAPARSYSPERTQGLPILPFLPRAARPSGQAALAFSRTGLEARFPPAPASSAPASSAPASSAPASSAPASSAPASSAPASSAPASSTPASSTPASSTPASSTPGWAVVELWELPVSGRDSTFLVWIQDQDGSIQVGTGERVGNDRARELGFSPVYMGLTVVRVQSGPGDAGAEEPSSGAGIATWNARWEMDGPDGARHAFEMELTSAGGGVPPLRASGRVGTRGEDWGLAVRRVERWRWATDGWITMDGERLPLRRNLPPWSPLGLSWQETFAALRAGDASYRAAPATAVHALEGSAIGAPARWLLADLGEEVRYRQVLEGSELQWVFQRIGEGLELAAIEVSAVQGEAPGLFLRFSPALPDLRQAGEESGRFALSAGPLSSAGADVLAWGGWSVTPAADGGWLRLDPQAPDWACSRPMAVRWRVGSEGEVSLQHERVPTERACESVQP